MFSFSECVKGRIVLLCLIAANLHMCAVVVFCAAGVANAFFVKPLVVAQIPALWMDWKTRMAI